MCCFNRSSSSRNRCRAVRKSFRSSELSGRVYGRKSYSFFFPFDFILADNTCGTISRTGVEPILS